MLGCCWLLSVAHLHFDFLSALFLGLGLFLLRMRCLGRIFWLFGVGLLVW